MLSGTKGSADKQVLSRIQGLFDYVAQVTQMSVKPQYELQPGYFSLHEFQIRGCADVCVDVARGGDDVWLCVPRLQETKAPSPTVDLLPWVEQSNDPARPARIRRQITVSGEDGAQRELSLEDNPRVMDSFKEYLRHHWDVWAAAESSRRATIALYNELFALFMVMNSEGTEQPLELAMGIGWVSWRAPGGKSVQYPLLTQLCELSLDQQSMELQLRPRQASSARAETSSFADMKLPGAYEVERAWRESRAAAAVELSPFEPTSYMPFLKAALGLLDASGRLVEKADWARVPVADEILKVHDSWVLFSRPRSMDIFLQDIRNLAQSAHDGVADSPILQALVSFAPDVSPDHSQTVYRGLSSSYSGPEARELYFPMPYNDEQVAVAQKLERSPGVIVQGPPGTGKSHTIANIICHYLAQGKRVLVTAKSENALQVVRDKLPESIRPLSVALLNSEQEGIKQFEAAISAISSKVVAMNPPRSAALILELEQRLARLHASIGSVDQRVAKHAGEHATLLAYEGRLRSPEELARIVLGQQADLEWFTDSLAKDALKVAPSESAHAQAVDEFSAPQVPDESLGFSDEDIAALRAARQAVGADLLLVGKRRLTLGMLPGVAQLRMLHEELTRAAVIQDRVESGELLPFKDFESATVEAAQALLAFLDARALAHEQAREHADLGGLQASVARLGPTDPVVVSLRQQCTEVQALESQRREFLAHAIEVPPRAEDDEDFLAAVSRCTQGKSPFVLGWGKASAKEKVAQVRVAGAAPRNAQEWSLVERLILWRKDARGVLARWSTLCAELDIETQAAGADVEAQVRSTQHRCAGVLATLRLRFDFNAQLHQKLSSVFASEAVQLIIKELGDDTQDLALSIRANIDRQALARALHERDALIASLAPFDSYPSKQLRSVLKEELGNLERSTQEIEQLWAHLQDQAARVERLEPHFQTIARVCARIQEAGATQWSHRLRTEPAGHLTDEACPVDWRERWQWKRAMQFLESIDSHRQVRELFEQRRKLTKELARTYGELIKEKTWLALHGACTADVLQALAAYQKAVTSIGAGTGRRVARYRQDAKAAMERAYKAVQCWILPHWRVSETLPPQFGLFDLVVVDEASQSDVLALPCLARGKKVLVVGDDKQVSPSMVGVTVDALNELQDRFLRDQPHKAQLSPDKSLYDLAYVVFADYQVMLKEHFRCAPAIIEFSRREFYNYEVRPLRIPSAAERLDPPLVDVFVHGGKKNGDTNQGEALAIVKTIEAILEDPVTANRTIGVVTLLGHAQAKLIKTMVSQRISPEFIKKNDIMVGEPPNFQGAERDIILLSLVTDASWSAPFSRADMRQRYNVGLSRARDRMYLFRSIEDHQATPGSLTAKVLAHFRQPFHVDVKKNQSLRELCESDFEKEVFDLLTHRGYSVQPQVASGAYRIDMVVEGDEGRRLAIECDGDRYHGPEKWNDDMARQRVLERAGWTFWRCFASSFVRNKEAVVADLLKTLDELGIEPMGSKALDQSSWVTRLEAHPFDDHWTLPSLARASEPADAHAAPTAQQRTSMEF